VIAREIVDHLERTKGADSQRNRDGDYHVTCPAHADTDPSLHVTDRDGRTLLCCQAGCQTQAVLDAAGLDWGDLFHDRANGHREIVATYPYTDPDGRLVFETVRYWPKDFRQRQPDGNGGWLWNITDPPCMRWLYRMPRVLEAIDTGQSLFICEGEKDADALEREGLYATCNPMGAGKWRGEHSRMLIGAADVNVVRDRDDKGREHADRVVSLLRAVDIEPTLLEPRAGKDVTDHFAAGHSWMNLVEVDADATGEFLGQEFLGQERRPSKKAVGRPAVLDLLVDMEQALEEADQPVPFLADPVAARGCLTLLVAKHSSFKSMFAMAVGHCCHAGGGDLAGIHCERARVLYVDAENGRRIMGRYFKAIGIPADGLLVADGSRIKLPRDLKKLRDLIEATEADLVVLDSLRRLTAGRRESDSDDMAPVIGALAALAHDLDVAIVLIHHRSSKPGAANQRGSSAIEDQADAFFALRRYPGQRLKLWVVDDKYRMGATPAPLWLTMGELNGVFGLGTTDPVSDADEGEDGAAPTAEADLIVRIRELADRVAKDGGWPPKQLAAAVGSDQRSGTFQRSLGELLTTGEWVAEGETRTRRVRPADPAQTQLDTGE
jgi:AAA domain